MVPLATDKILGSNDLLLLGIDEPETIITVLMGVGVLMDDALMGVGVLVGSMPSTDSQSPVGVLCEPLGHLAIPSAGKSIP